MEYKQSKEFKSQVIKQMLLYQHFVVHTLI